MMQTQKLTVRELARFARLGEAIKRDYDAASCDERAFPDVAEKHLRAFDALGDVQLDPAELLEWMLSRAAPPPRHSEFGNMALSLYQCREFLIELLVWTDSTTAIHGHGFSGAFRVAAGSSIQATWKFDESRRYGAALRLGSMRLERLERLTVGSVQRIDSGSAGLVHALFHLESPSVTIVARTWSEPWSHPQLSYLPPGIAFDSQQLVDHPDERFFARALDTFLQLPGTDIVALLQRAGRDVPLPRLVGFYLGVAHKLSPADHARVREAFAAYDLVLAHALHEAVVLNATKGRLLQLRRRVTDPDARFVLAVILNAHDEERARALVAAHLGEGIAARQLLSAILGDLLAQGLLDTDFALTGQSVRELVDLYAKVHTWAEYLDAVTRVFDDDAVAEHREDLERLYGGLDRLPGFRGVFGALDLQAND